MIVQVGDELNAISADDLLALALVSWKERKFHIGGLSGICPQPSGNPDKRLELRKHT